MVSRSVIRLLALMVVILLPACGELPVKSQDSEDPGLQAAKRKLVEQRQEQLNLLTQWEFNGRISLLTSSESWSGQIFWRQSELGYLIQFNAPSGQGAMQLLGSDDSVELRLANGDSYQAKDAETLLRQETTWDLPVKGMWFWIRGLPNPQLSQQKVKLDEQGLIKELVQKDWRIQYDSYQQYGNNYFPRKILIQNEDTKVRLIVTNWNVS